RRHALRSVSQRSQQGRHPVEPQGALRTRHSRTRGVQGTGGQGQDRLGSL
ncbi:uncharacterized protein METZ01_LOCUS356836, partial [marine metagenome]